MNLLASDEAMRRPALALGFWGLSGPVEVNGIQLGWPSLPIATVRNVVAQAVAAGIRVFDTASIYGNGIGEQLIGECAAILPDDAVISTKAGLQSDGMAPPHKIPRSFSADHILHSLERSLLRLRRPQVEIFLLHGATLESLEDEGLWQALEREKAKGKIGRLGVSLRRSELDNPAYFDRIETNPYIAVVQAPVNPVYASMVKRLERGALSTKQVLGRSPYFHGFLLRTASMHLYSAADHRAGLVKESTFAKILGTADKVRHLSSECGIDRKTLLLHFAVRFSSSGMCILGATNRRQIESSVEAFHVPVPEDILQRMLAW